MKPLLELKDRDCRWPLDNGLFCADRRGRGAYCETHAKRAYRSDPERKGERDEAKAP